MHDHCLHACYKYHKLVEVDGKIDINILLYSPEKIYNTMYNDNSIVCRKEVITTYDCDSHLGRHLGFGMHLFYTNVPTITKSRIVLMFMNEMFYQVV